MISLRSTDGPLASGRANAAIVVYVAFFNSCVVYALLLVFLPSYLGSEPLLRDESMVGVLKLAFLGMSVPALVAGNLIANLGIVPNGWEKEPAGWRLAEERLKGNDSPDTAASFFERSFVRLIAAMALVETVATFGFILGLLGGPATRGSAFAFIVLGAISLLALLPRALYVKRTAEAIAAIERGDVSPASRF